MAKWHLLADERSGIDVFHAKYQKGPFGEDDGYDDQYIDDGPQMVNNNSGFGSADSYDEEGGEIGRAHV